LTSDAKVFHEAVIELREKVKPPSQRLAGEVEETSFQDKVIFKTAERIFWNLVQLMYIKKSSMIKSSVACLALKKGVQCAHGVGRRRSLYFVDRKMRPLAV
jgi:hypothetical protein